MGRHRQSGQSWDGEAQAEGTELGWGRHRQRGQGPHREVMGANEGFLQVGQEASQGKLPGKAEDSQAETPEGQAAGYTCTKAWGCGGPGRSQMRSVLPADPTRCGSDRPYTQPLWVSLSFPKAAA